MADNKDLIKEFDKKFLETEEQNINQKIIEDVLGHNDVVQWICPSEATVRHILTLYGKWESEFTGESMYGYIKRHWNDNNV